MSAMKSLQKNCVKKSIYSYLYILPVFLFLILFMLVPFMTAIIKSFYNYDMLTHNEFIGFENYINLFTNDEKFVISMKNLIPTCIGFLVSFQFPILVAKLVVSLHSERLQYVMRSSFLLPMGVPGIVTMLMWKFLYYPEIGVLARIFQFFSLEAPNFLGQPQYAMLSMIMIGFPWVAGLNFIIVYAALQGIDESVLEASKLDGAGAFRRFFSVELPLIIPQLKALLILGIIGTIQNYEKFLILTQGGPNNATLVPGLHMYNMAFGSGGNFGYSCAIATTLFILTMILVMATFNLRKENDV